MYTPYTQFVYFSPLRQICTQRIALYLSHCIHTQTHTSIHPVSQPASQPYVPHVRQPHTNTQLPAQFIDLPRHTDTIYMLVWFGLRVYKQSHTFKEVPLSVCSVGLHVCVPCNMCMHMTNVHTNRVFTTDYVIFSCISWILFFAVLSRAIHHSSALLLPFFQSFSYTRLYSMACRQTIEILRTALVVFLSFSRFCPLSFSLALALILYAICMCCCC